MLTSSAVRNSIRHPEVFAKLIGFADLSEVHARWIKKILTLPERGTWAMQAHRNSYKTSAGITALILLLLVNPDVRILIVRKSETNAVKILTAIQKLFAHNSLLQELFKLRYGTASPGPVWSQTRAEFAFRRRVQVEPTLSVAGIGTSITGAHFDYIWCDDIVTIDDRLSRAERERTITYLAELRNILDPQGRLIVTGTPWHKDDAFAVFPACEKFPVGTVPNTKIDEQKITELKSSMPVSLWAANYELRFVEDVNPEFPPMQTTTELPAERVWYIDPAFGGEDYTAVFEAGLSSEKIIVTWAAHVQRSVGDMFDELEKIFWLRGVKKIYYEENSAQKLIGTELRRRNIPCAGVKNVQNKYARIVATLKPAWNNLYFHPDVFLLTPAAIEEIKSYNEHSLHDDAADALAGVVSCLRKGVVESFEVSWL